MRLPFPFGPTRAGNATLGWGATPSSLLPPGFSLTRSSANATYFDSAGLLQTAAADVARGTYRYPTTAPRSGQWGQLPGTAGSYFSTPDSAAASITGDIDIRVKAALTDWTPSTTYMLLSKSDGAAQSAYLLYINGTGNLLFNYSSNGSNSFTATADAATGISDGATAFVRATYASSTGKVNFYKSDDGTIWTQIGTEQTLAANAIFNSTSPVEVGSYAAGAIPLLGKVYQAQVYNGINGTLAVNFNADDYASGTTWAASTTGETWTVNGAASIAWPWVFDGTMIEQATENIVLQSNELGTSPWALSGTGFTAAKTRTGVTGVANSAWLLTDASPLSIGNTHQLGLATTAATYVLSFQVEKTSGPQASYPVVWVIDQPNTSAAFVTIDTSNAIATAWTAYTGVTVVASSAAVVDETPTWFRVRLTFAASGANWQCFVAPAGTTNATQSTGVLDATAQGSAGFGNFGLELGSSATSYIATGAASATRNADVVTATTAGLLVNGQGFAAMKFRTIAGSGSNANLSGADGGGGEGQPIASSAINASIYDGTNIQSVNTTNAQTPGAICTLASAWGPSIFRIAADGVVGANFPGWAGSMGFCPTLRIGDNPTLGGQPISMVLQSMRLGTTQLSSPSLARLTT